MSEHFLKQKKKKIKNEIREREREREKKKKLIIDALNIKDLEILGHYF